MRLVVRHVSRYQYSYRVYQFASEMHLEPRNNPNQVVERFVLTVDPSVNLYSYTDRFRNRVHHFTIPEGISDLTVVAESWVSTVKGVPNTEPPSNFLLYECLGSTQRVPFSPTIRQWLGKSSTMGLSYEVSRALCQTVFEEFEYQTGMTSVQSTALDLLSTGAGVCQDFAHFLIALLRLRNIPALYVSGYVLPIDGPASASHAWVTAYVSDSTGSRWIGLDPTTGQEIDERYVAVAVGRDYDDVTPLRGVYLGPSDETMSVQVSIDQ